MNRQVITVGLLVAVVVSGALGFLGSLPGVPDALGVGLGGLGLLLATGGAVGQYRLAGPYIRRFAEADWVEVTTGTWRIDISAKEHGKGRAPHTTVLGLQPGGTLEEVYLDATEVPGTGALFLLSNVRFEGEVRIS